MGFTLGVLSVIWVGLGFVPDQLRQQKSGNKMGLAVRRHAMAAAVFGDVSGG